MSSSPIKDVLAALSRHGDLINSALDGPIDPREGIVPRALSELRQVSALRPAGDDTYRLHPRLREYLYDHLQLYPAYQSLSQIGADIDVMRALWGTIEDMKRAGDTDALTQARDRMQDTAFDIADNMQRNLTQLNTLLSTRYGNVRSLAAKRSQNRWYQKQTESLQRELALLSAVGGTIERDATAVGMSDLTRFMHRNLLSQILGWQQAISEMQTLLSKEIFRTREIEMQHRQLARMDTLLRQQPGWQGVDIEVDGDLPDFLLAARLPPVIAHVEPDDSERDIQDLLIDSAASLAPLSPRTLDEPPKKLRRQTPVHETPPPTPAMRAAERLYSRVKVATDGVSLIDWRCSDTDAMTMSPNVWLIFATTDLRNRHMKVVPVLAGKVSGKRRSHIFVDAVASGPNRIWNQG